MAFRRTQFLDKFWDAIEDTPGLADLVVTRYDDAVSESKGRGDIVHIMALALPRPVDIVPGSVDIQEITDKGTEVKLDVWKGLTLPVTSADRALNDPAWLGEMMRQGARGLKDELDRVILSLAADATVTQEANTGTPNGGEWGDPDMLEVHRLLSDARLPASDRFLIGSPDAGVDLRKISTFISADFAEGQSQNILGKIRGMTFMERPTDFFTTKDDVLQCMGLHKSSIACIIVSPDVKVSADAGQRRDIIEIDFIAGVKVLNPSGIVRIYR